MYPIQGLEVYKLIFFLILLALEDYFQEFPEPPENNLNNNSTKKEKQEYLQALNNYKKEVEEIRVNKRSAWLFFWGPQNLSNYGRIVELLGIPRRTPTQWLDHWEEIYGTRDLRTIRLEMKMDRRVAIP